MKKITNGKIFALCLGDFARGLINGIITTYLYFGTLNEATKSIRIIPVVVFKDKA